MNRADPWHESMGWDIATMDELGLKRSQGNANNYKMPPVCFVCTCSGRVPTRGIFGIMYILARLNRHTYFRMDADTAAKRRENILLVVRRLYSLHLLRACGFGRLPCS